LLEVHNKVQYDWWSQKHFGGK